MAYLTLKVADFNPCGVFLSDPVNNTVIPGGKFMRTGYSNSDMTLTSIHILVNGVGHTGRKDGVYVIPDGCIWAGKLVEIERHMLSLVHDKIPRYRIAKQVRAGEFRLSDACHRTLAQNLIVKISGVWVTERECGLTYKIIPTS